MQGCALRPAECPVTASSPCHLSQVKAASLSAGSPGKAVGVRFLQPRGFDGEFMVGSKWKSILGTEQLVGWENTRSAALAPIHLPLLIAAGLIIFHLSGQGIHVSYYN